MSLQPLIDSGRFRAPCGSCDREIARGEPRVSEPVNDGRVPNAKYRHHHFECAIDKLPKLVHRILIDELYDTALISDPSALKVEVYDRILALETGKPPPPRRVLVVPDPRIERELMPALIANPEDTEVLSVLGDLLTERGDPRGELITLDLQMVPGGPGWESEWHLTRQRELRNQLLPPLINRTRAHCLWGVGFIRWVETGPWSRTAYDGNLVIKEPFTERWTHQSLRLLQHLSIVGDPAQWLTTELPALRQLSIASRDVTALPAMPNLRTLSIVAAVDDKLLRLLEETFSANRLETLNLNRRTPENYYEPLRALCETLIP